MHHILWLAIPNRRAVCQKLLKNIPIDIKNKVLPATPHKNKGVFMLKNTKQYLTTGLLAIVLSTLNICKALPASAASSSFRLSPMYQNVSLIPGESSQGTFIITNPANNEVNFDLESNKTIVFDNEEKVSNLFSIKF